MSSDVFRPVVVTDATMPDLRSHPTLDNMFHASMGAYSSPQHLFAAREKTATEVCVRLYTGLN